MFFFCLYCYRQRKIYWEGCSVLKRRGSMEIDMIFSIFTVVMIVCFVEIGTKNLCAINSKINEEIGKREAITLEAEGEKAEITGFSGGQEMLIENKEYTSWGYNINKKRKIINREFGLVKTEILMEKKGISEKIEVYGILGEGENEFEEQSIE